MVRDPLSPRADAFPHGPASRRGEEPFIIFVCRANRCRSPLAEHLAGSHAARQGVEARFASMGFLEPGLPTPEAGVRAAAEQGIQLVGHRSRTLDPEDLQAADLVLAMGRSEARDLVVDLPDLWPRVHTLKGFVARAASRPRPAPGAFAPWVETLHEGRERTDLVGDVAADEVADPMGRSNRVWRRTILELDGLVERLLASCVPDQPLPGSPRR